MSRLLLGVVHQKEKKKKVNQAKQKNANQAIPKETNLNYRKQMTEIKTSIISVHH